MDSEQNIWALVTDVWHRGWLGIDVGKIAIAVVILAACLLLRGLFARFVIARLRARVTKTENKLDDEALDALEGPLGIIPLVIGIFVVVRLLDLTGDLEIAGQRLVRSLIAFILFWSLFRLVEPFAFLLKRLADVFSEELVDWTKTAIKIAFLLIGAATILEIWGIAIAPIIAGFGLFGVAVALGAQDLFKNLIAGLMILAEKRFNRGNWVRVDGIVEGVVESIGFRSTLIRRFDKAPVYVPNALLSDNSVINFSKMSNRRIYWTVGVEYRTTVDQLRQIRDEIEKYLQEDPEIAQPPTAPLAVRIEKFNDSSIDILVYSFTKTTSWDAWLVVRERLAYAIKDIVEAAGTGFAFPSRTIYVEAGATDEPPPAIHVST